MCKEYAPMIFELALAERMTLQVQFLDNQQQSNNHKMIVKMKNLNFATNQLGICYNREYLAKHIDLII